MMIKIYKIHKFTISLPVFKGSSQMQMCNITVLLIVLYPKLYIETEPGKRSGARWMDGIGKKLMVSPEDTKASEKSV